MWPSIFGSIGVFGAFAVILALLLRPDGETPARRRRPPRHRRPPPLPRATTRADTCRERDTECASCRGQRSAAGAASSGRSRPDSGCTTAAYAAGGTAAPGRHGSGRRDESLLTLARQHRRFNNVDPIFAADTPLRSSD